MSSQLNPVSLTAACAGAAAIILAAGAAFGQQTEVDEHVIVLEEEHPVRVFVRDGGGQVDVDEDVIRILGPDGRVLRELDKRRLMGDGAKRRGMIWRDADTDSDVDVQIRGKTIVIGPDGEKRVREFGDEEIEIELEEEIRRHIEDGDIDRAMRELRRTLEGLRLHHHDAEIHMDDDHTRGMLERLHEHLGHLKDGDVHVEMRGKGVFIGPDGEVHEFDLDEGEMHEWMGKLHGHDFDLDFDFEGAPFDGAWRFKGLPGAHGEEGRLFRVLPESGAPSAWLGIAMQPVSEDLASYFDLDAGAVTRIGSVVDGSPAAKAGLRAKDIVVEVEGETKASPEAIVEAVAAREPGDEIELTVIRDGARRAVRVTLGERASRAEWKPEAFDLPRGARGLFAVPDAPVPPAPPADGRIEDRLDRLERQIQRLEHMLERMEPRPAEPERRVRPRRQRSADPASIS